MNQEILELLATVVRKDKEIVLEQLDLPDQVDSLTLVEIVFAMEDQFGIVLTDEDIAPMKTYRTLINQVERKIG